MRKLTKALFLLSLIVLPSIGYSGAWYSYDKPSDLEEKKKHAMEIMKKKCAAQSEMKNMKHDMKNMHGNMKGMAKDVNDPKMKENINNMRSDMGNMHSNMKNMHSNMEEYCENLE